MCFPRSITAILLNEASYFKGILIENFLKCAQHKMARERKKINTHIIIFQRYQAQLLCDSVEWSKQKFKNQFEYCENNSNANSLDCLKSHPFEYVYNCTCQLEFCTRHVATSLFRLSWKRKTKEKINKKDLIISLSSLQQRFIGFGLIVFSANADAFKMYKPSSAEYLICALYKNMLTFTMPKIACLG